MISSILFFVVCIKTVKKEEEQKAEEKQLKILEAYIKNLEQLNEKTSAFRHDYKNILSGLSGFLKRRQNRRNDRLSVRNHTCNRKDQ